MSVMFPAAYKPDADSTYDRQPRVLVAPFGDGYSQQLADGINAYGESWSIGFSHRPKADIAAIKLFLDTVSAITPFLWTAPDTTFYTKWRMTTAGYKITNGEADTRTLNVTFERYFG